MLWFCQEIAPGLVVGFTDSDSGNLALHVGDTANNVVVNRVAVNADVSSALGTGAEVTLRFMNQVHGNQVAKMEGPLTAAPTADAMVSTTESLAVMVADCVPVVLVGRTATGLHILAVAHAGRPGVETGVVPATIKALLDDGAQSIDAWVGPSVCGSCYEVPEQMRAAVALAEPAAYSTTSWGTPALDLPAAVVSQLQSAGVTVHNVGVCTLENPNFFSHRRAVRDGEAEGRFIGFAAKA